MSISKRTKILRDLASMAEEDEKHCKRHFQAISQFSDILLDTANLKNTLLSNTECKSLFEESYRIDEKCFNDKYCELEKKYKQLQTKQKIVIKKQEETELLKHKLESNSELPKRTQQLANLEILLKYYKILPAEFDYSDKQVTGFIFNADNGEYHSFELDPKSKEGNTKYLWKQTEFIHKKKHKIQVT